ncbi:nicotinamide mononucleotide adenylyltransferase [Hufsiella ginkgonis]|uniref:Nicotinamide mononucleotide adenylyltransferase n=1 Tax=Hufsiella ginkgonis TaxID=2695274 RepID=A0A7K1XS46_9SPHI|nr:nicotinamide mononucleotide adenylyltransferase [Hufsiella ginkgonis]MXV13813.1 nicotinamide mononucleotide adenylyltransferase [Hufsiella ginkgonis]
MAREILETRRKALKINLDVPIYGTFAEIGAGQEVARNFFTAGAASGTVAKTMSAYDMSFSNSIYGEETSGRYVSKSRLLKMLDHEFGLLSERLIGEKHHHKTFFAFADTVTTLNFNKTNDPHGWLGIRFQVTPGGPPNDIVFHVRLLDSDSVLQQNVLGILGVNLVYAAFYHHQQVRLMIESLVDNLTPGSVEIDLISLQGPVFSDANDRLVNLYLIAKGFSGAAIFDKDASALQAKDLLYKKDIMILRTRYKQKSTPNFDLFNRAVEQFKRSQHVADENLVVLIEVLMTNLFGEGAEPDSADLDALAARAEDLCATGNYVIVSDFSRNHKLAAYLARCKPNSVGISTNIANLKRIFDSTSFGERYTDELLAYVSDLFSKNVKLYAYPYLDKKNNDEIITTRNMPVSGEAKPLFEFLVKNAYITDIEEFDRKDVKTV